jgi:hypothetical protein
MGLGLSVEEDEEDRYDDEEDEDQQPLIVQRGCVYCTRLSPIIFRQIAAGLHRGGPSLARDPNTIRAAFTCVELVRESRDPTPSLHQALIHTSLNTSLELVQGEASARSLRGETVKPVFIEDRAASLMELIADVLVLLRMAPLWPLPSGRHGTQ